jgi:hypothetical protein
MRKRIRMSRHKPNCLDPWFSNRKLYIRATVGKGKQQDIPFGNFCTSCGEFEREDYTLRFKTSKAVGSLERKFSSEEIEEIRRATGLTVEQPTTTIRGSLRTRDKIIQNEASLRSKIKGLDVSIKQLF